MVDVSSSIEAAQTFERQLNALVQQVLETNQEISSQLAEMKIDLSTEPSSVTFTSRDIEGTEDNCFTIGPKIRVPRKIGIETADDGQDLIKGFGFTFDRDLGASRVYMRALSRNPLSLCSSSIGPSMGWSLMSGLSLGEVSNLSVISLPISSNELWNAESHGSGIALSLPFSATESTSARDFPPIESRRPSIQSHSHPPRSMFPFLRYNEDEKLVNEQAKDKDQVDMFGLSSSSPIPICAPRVSEPSEEISQSWQRFVN